MHPSCGDGASPGGSRARDPVLFFDTYGAMSIVGRACLKKLLFGLESLDFGDRDER